MTSALRSLCVCLLAVSVLLALPLAPREQTAPLAQRQKLLFGVGPLQATPTETKKAFEPFFAHVAKMLDRDYDLVATTDWAGISVALANEQVDVAWMGPWGYILANNDSGVTAIATAKYDGKPIYHAIVVCKPGSGVKTWPEDGKSRRVSFADVGSTSGWLIPTAWFKIRGIDPKEYFRYSDGATHAANEIAVASGQADCATDFDRNRNAMVARTGVAVVASLHQVQLALAYADRVIALRAGRVVQDAPAAGLDARDLEAIYGKNGRGEEAP